MQQAAPSMLAGPQARQPGEGAQAVMLLLSTCPLGKPPGEAPEHKRGALPCHGPHPVAQKGMQTAAHTPSGGRRRQAGLMTASAPP